MPDPFFQGKIALVTGASSGIGKETARLLAAQGAKVALLARNAAALQALVDEIQSRGGEALALPTDVSRREQVEAAVKATMIRWDRIDILVANAGQYIRVPVAQLSVEDVERSLAVNFYGGLYAVLAALPGMLEQRSGSLVLVLTMDVKTPVPPDAPYVIAKCALSGFGDLLRQELKSSGIYTSMIYPGRVDSPMIENIQVPSISAKIPPRMVAIAILRAIRKRQAEVILPPQAKLLYLFRFLSPGLSDWYTRVFHLEGWERS